ncbi:MAG: sigma-70 family RNA polymerase sigma factor [Planctomycetaceae bacterium]|nr:sigma-70 family RNA polymerase sigma factor [Planctomycetaceae bacterium]
MSDFAVLWNNVKRHFFSYFRIYFGRMGISKTQASLLFLAHHGYVKRLAVRQAPLHGICDDIVQQVFIEFTEKAEQWEISDDVRPLLAGITKKVVLSYWRDHSRHNRPDVLLKIAEHLRKLGDDDPTPEQHEEEICALRLCLEEIPLKHRRVIDLYYFERMTTQEIASIIKKKTATVHRMLCRIRAKLRTGICRRLNHGETQ